MSINEGANRMTNNETNKLIRDEISYILENNDVSDSTITKINNLLIRDLNDDFNDEKVKIYSRDNVRASKLRECCYRRVTYGFNNDVIKELYATDVQIAEGNWYAITILEKDGKSNAYLYNNRKAIASPDIRSTIMFGTVSALQLLKADDLIHLNPAAYPLKKLVDKNFIGFHLLRGKVVTDIAKYRLPHHLK